MDVKGCVCQGIIALNRLRNQLRWLNNNTTYCTMCVHVQTDKLTTVRSLRGLEVDWNVMSNAGGCQNLVKWVVRTFEVGKYRLRTSYSECWWNVTRLVGSSLFFSFLHISVSRHVGPAPDAPNHHWCDPGSECDAKDLVQHTAKQWPALQHCSVELQQPAGENRKGASVCIQYRV